jgi:type IV pilus assembly protein PilX
MTPAHPLKIPASGSRQSQTGASLIVALLLLVVMTMLGVSVLRTVTQEERMVAHSYDRSISFQATEAALRQAEAYVKSKVPTPTGSTCDTSNGVCGKLASGSTERWLDSSFTSWFSGTKVSGGNTEITPQYIIEYLGNTYPCRPEDLTAASNCKRYRITARSNAGTDRAAVMLQSIYAAE